MKLKTALPSAAALAALAAMLAPMSSSAADEKVLPGSICQPTSVGISAQRMFYSGGSVVNFTNESQGVQVARMHCPLVRDNIVRKWTYLYVRVNDNTTTGSVRCTASNFGSFGENPYNVSRETGTSFTGLYSLYFPAPTDQKTAGAFHVFCELPGNSRTGAFSAIHSIRLAEVEE